MNLSFETVLTTLTASFLLFGIACYMLARAKRIIAVGFQTIVFICTLSIVRLMLPAELFFSKTLRLGGLFTNTVSFFRQRHDLFLGFSIYPWSILIAVWVIGIVWHLYKFFKSYRADAVLIYNIGTPVSDQLEYEVPLRAACKLCNTDHQFEILKIRGINTPAIFSLFKPIIILPADFKYDSQELEVIFRHEIGHFVHHHLLYKFLIELFLTVYWWNPFNSCIRLQIDTLLEMSIDRTLTSNTKEMILYMECLLSTVKKTAIAKSVSLSSTTSLSLSNFKENMLVKRFDVMMHRPKRHVFLSTLLVAISLTIFSGSFCYTLKGYATPDEVISGAYFSLEEDAYAVLNACGTYDLYYNGEYLETVDSLKGYEGMHIHN